MVEFFLLPTARLVFFSVAISPDQIHNSKCCSLSTFINQRQSIIKVHNKKAGSYIG